MQRYSKRVEKQNKTCFNFVFPSAAYLHRR